MKIDFNSIIQSRIEVLKSRMQALENVKNIFSLSKGIEFSVSEISDVKNPFIKGEKIGLSCLNELENKKGGIIYIFEIVDKKIKPQLLSKIESYRSKGFDNIEDKKLKRYTSKLPNNAKSNDSNILYIGSVEKSIHLRIRQHLGSGNSQTYALQLKHWAEKDWKFRFYYFDVEEIEIIRDIEASLSQALNPLIGKREK